jgi:hypothetical protein
MKSLSTPSSIHHHDDQNHWVTLGFGLSHQLLLVPYPWGNVCYPLFGYLA